MNTAVEGGGCQKSSEFWMGLWKNQTAEDEAWEGEGGFPGARWFSYPCNTPNRALVPTQRSAPGPVDWE
jgi:hypothetical protein